MADHARDETRRNERARTATLKAAWKLFGQRGLRQLTIEAIAQEAGVGKATIYRWWPSKAAVVMDALSAHLDPAIPFPDTGSAREDLRTHLAAVIALFRTKPGRAFLALVAESQHDKQLARALAERYIASRRAGAAEVLHRGIDRGELRRDVDPGLAIDALYGAIYYRMLVSHAHTDMSYADELVAQFYPALVAG